MKTLLLITILCAAACLTSLAQQPDLPRSITAVSLADFRKFAAAADTLKARAERRINALQQELAALNEARLSGTKLTEYDEEKQRELVRELSFTEADLREANRVYALIIDNLPRRYRRQAKVSPMAIYECLTDYESRLIRRAKRTFVIGNVLGFVAGVYGTIRLLR